MQLRNQEIERDVESLRDIQITDSVNCFAGGLEFVFKNILHRNISEHDIMLAGSGFEFQASTDEYGFPEFIVQVLPTCFQALSRFNCRLVEDRLSGEHIIAQLQETLRKFGHVIVWVNSRHLHYSPLYRSRDGYLHSIVVTDIQEAKGLVRVFEPLIVDRKRVSGFVWMRLPDLLDGLTKEVLGNELAPEMGKCYTITDADDATARYTARFEIGRQCFSNLFRNEHATALATYERDCMIALTGPRGAEAARRLFHHISPLFALPVLHHVERVLNTIEAPEPCFERHKACVANWRELGILALKFEASQSPELLLRIQNKFGVLRSAMEELWSGILIHATAAHMPAERTAD